MGKFHTVNFGQFDDLDLNTIQKIIQNQEIAYNDSLTKPKGILRVATLTTDKTFSTSTNDANFVEITHLKYTEFDSSRLYRIKAIANIIRCVPPTPAAMRISDDTGRVLRQTNFFAPQPPHMSALFRPINTTHTITWYGSTCGGDVNNHWSWTLDNTHTFENSLTNYTSSVLILEDLGVYIPGSGPQ